jgi:hypothetical protein
MNTLSHPLSYLALFFTLVSVILGVKSQSIKIRDDMDNFVHDLQAQGTWATCASWSQAIAVVILIARVFLTGDA